MAVTDHPLKRLVALAAVDFATWFLGAEVRQVEPRSIQLTANPEPVDADQVLLVTLADGREALLHLEFQGPGSHKPMPMRILDYMSRLVQAYREIPIHSAVLYLGGAGRTDTGEHQVVGLDGRVQLAWTYLAVQLWQMDANALLALDRPGLLALIGQTRITQPKQIVSQAIARITTSTSGELRQRLLEELLLLCADEEVAIMAEQLIEREGLLLD
ncbi:MAG: hypothetical protein MI924_05330, partial [Chloroflexales bacterium]|nr:hypothetical protein [Chloroflexales bacterium]